MKKSAQIKKKKKVRVGLIATSPLVKGLIGLLPGIIAVMLAVSLFSSSKGVKQKAVELINLNPGSVESHLALAKVAARSGDGALAKSEYLVAERLGGGGVLGVTSEDEELLFPEETVREALNRWESEAKETVSSKLYLRISGWYWRLNETEKAKEAWRKAIEIDPNDQVIKNWGEILGGE